MPFKPRNLKEYICADKEAVEQLKELLQVQNIKDAPEFKRFLKYKPFNKRGRKMTSKVRNEFYERVMEKIGQTVKNLTEKDIADIQVHELQALYDHIDNIGEGRTCKKALDIEIKGQYYFMWHMDMKCFKNHLVWQYGMYLQDFAREHFNAVLQKD